MQGPHKLGKYRDGNLQLFVNFQLFPSQRMLPKYRFRCFWCFKGVWGDFSFFHWLILILESTWKGNARLKRPWKGSSWKLPCSVWTLPCFLQLGSELRFIGYKIVFDLISAKTYVPVCVILFAVLSLYNTPCYNTDLDITQSWLPNFFYHGIFTRELFYPSWVLVQPRKTRPCLTERLLMGRKESNQTNKTREL